MVWQHPGPCIALVLLCMFFRISSSFVHPRFGGKKDFPTRVNLSIEVEEKTSMATLTFRGELTLKSAPAKALENDKIYEFFKKAEHRNLLVSAGGLRPASEVPLTNEILEEWKKAASKVGGTIPTGDEGEALMKVETGGVRFPGLTVTSNAVIGSKLFELPTKRPLYEFVLVKDEQSVEGLPPMVWVFNQLTGSGTKESKSETTARSISKVTAEIDDSTKELIFQLACSLKVDIELPTLLLRILPVSKERAEEQGSAAVLKAVEVDAAKGLSKFREAYDTWV